MDGFTAQDMQDEYDAFMEKYDFTIYEVTDENRITVERVNPKYVWTSHSTCEDNYVAPGFLEFSPSNCCWHEDAWYVSNIAWEDSDEWIRTSHYFPCIACNPDGEKDSGEENCTVCEGEGFYQYYTD